jgi:Icc-related predicted phosphoesterase
MKLAIYSDLHLEHAPFESPHNLQADVVILAGDIHAPGSNVSRWARRASVFGDRPVIHVAGNHEFYGSEVASQRRRMQEEAQKHGIHHLQMGQVVIGGVRFLGTTLWTDFELEVPTRAHGGDPPLRDRAMAECAMYLNDYRCIELMTHAEGVRHNVKRWLKPADTLEMHQRERAWLLAALNEPFDGPTVVITHHAPHRGSIAHRFEGELMNAGFASQLPDEFFESPTLWIHGHTHTRFDYGAGNCRIVCNPRGYPLRSGAFEVDGFDEQGLGIELRGA